MWRRRGGGGGGGSRKSIVTRDREGERVREWEEERGVERGGHIERERGRAKIECERV